MSSIRIADLLAVYQDITEVMESIDKCMGPGVDRAMAWKKLNDSRNILRVAIEKAGTVEIKEADGPYRGHPQDPRTPEGPDRYEWEADNSPLGYMDSTELDVILSELLHGDADVARASLKIAVEARFQQYLIDQAQQDAEDIARDRYEDRWVA